MQKLIAYCRLNLKNRKFLEAYKNIRSRQYLSYAENQKRQLDKLNALLTHAYRHIPYYKEMFEALNMVENNEVVLYSLDELQKLPFLTKEIIRLQEDKIYSDDKDQRFPYLNSSGGSTGKPLSLLQDAQYRLSNSIHTQLAYSWRGYSPYDDMVVIWGAERDIFQGKRSFRDTLEDIYYGRTMLNSFSMSEEDMQNYISLLNRKKPKLIKAYAQSIYEIAKFAKKNNIHVEKQEAIHLAAGTVYESMRTLIEEVFACKAYNYYGSREVGAIASECSEQNGLHLLMEHTLVEVVNSKGEPCAVGEQGEIVLTTLENYTMPLIRYKIGDVGVLQGYSACDCGCTYPKLEKIVGRVTDLFKTKDGAKIDGEYFTHLFYFRDWIEQFQVLQDNVDEIRIKIVKNSAVVKTDISDIEAKIKMVMGEDCQVIFDYVEEIPKTLTGKFRYTISTIE